MKTRIIDEPALGAISVLDLKSYLKGRGWRKSRDLGQRAQVYGHTAADGTSHEVMVPLRPELADYADVVGLTIATLAAVEDRSAVLVYEDIATAGFDILRVGIRAGDVAGVLPVDDGVRLVERARDLVRTAALTADAAAPKTIFGQGRRSERVQDYLGSVKLGQTQRGSFIVSILSPVDPAFRGSPEQTDLFPPEPFPRVVTKTLYTGLGSLRAAAIDATAANDITPFREAVAKGVSATLCETVADVIALGQGATFGLSWAGIRPSGLPPAQLRFEGSMAGTLRAAAADLKTRESEHDVAILAYVIAMARDVEAFDGKVTLEIVNATPRRRATALFGDIDFPTLLRAFEKKLPVALTGDLIRVGRRTELRNPTGLELLAPSEEVGEEG